MGKPDQEAVSKHASVTDEHRKLASELTHTPYEQRPQLLADALAKVRRETLEEAAKEASRWTTYLVIHGSADTPEMAIRALAAKEGKP